MMQALAMNQEEIKKFARIELKTSPTVKRELEIAANTSGVSLTAFILNEAVQKAKSIIEAERMTQLNDTAFAALERVMRTPEPASVALKELLAMEK